MAALPTQQHHWAQFRQEEVKPPGSPAVEERPRQKAITSTATPEGHHLNDGR
jgi:hypothetical protein